MLLHVSDCYNSSFETRVSSYDLGIDTVFIYPTLSNPTYYS